MPLTSKQKKLIIDVDRKVNNILACGGDEEMLLIEMLELMPGIKTIIDSTIDSTSKKEMDMYFQEYDGFYYYMKVLENLARCIKDGKIPVPE